MEEDLYKAIRLLFEDIEVPESTDEACMEAIRKCIAEKQKLCQMRGCMQ
jgi:hypothetical protein